MINKLKYIFILGFLIVTIIPGLGVLFYPNTEVIKKAENRNPVYLDKPLTRPLLEQYFSDRLFLKYPMLRVWSELNFLIGASIKPDQIVIGNDNWLFLGDHHFETVSQYRRIKEVEQTEANAKINVLRRINDYLNEKKIKFIFTVAPDKVYIYPEKFPSYIKPLNKPHRLALIKKALTEEKIPFIDYTEPLLKAKKQGQILYYPYDSHWNRMGAYVAYNSLTHKLKEILPQFHNKQITDVTLMNETGWVNSATILLLSNKSSTNTYPWSNNFEEQVTMMKEGERKSWEAMRIFPDVNASSVDSPVTFINEMADNDLTCLVIGDSFSINMSPYLHQSFKRTTYIYNLSLKDKNVLAAIDKFKPDIVLFEIVQRHLIIDFPYFYPLD